MRRNDGARVKIKGLFRCTQQRHCTAQALGRPMEVYRYPPWEDMRVQIWQAQGRGVKTKSGFTCKNGIDVRKARHALTKGAGTCRALSLYD